MKKTIQTIICAACISLVSTIIVADDASAQRKGKMRNFVKQKNLKSQDLPRGRFKNRFERLSRRGQDRAMRNLRKFHFTERDLDDLKIDNDGELVYEDAHFTNFGFSAGSSQVARVGENVDVFALSSRPESQHTIFLDFDGQIIQDTRWNINYDSESWDALPYNRDQNPYDFSDVERAEIFEIWRRVAEDFKPFDVNVTTQDPGVRDNKMITALITSNMDANNVPMPASHAGGVAFVNVWGRSTVQYYQPAIAYTFSNAANTALVVSHELGHNLGLSHDGTSATGYYRGHGTGTETWGPIMGAPYNRSLTQWSRGDYADANNTQDDVAEIGERLGMAGDDHDDEMQASTALTVDADGIVNATRPDTDADNQVDVNKGTIGHAGDADTFSFESYGGPATLMVSRLRENDTTASNLDLIATLYDPYGNALAQQGARPGEDIELAAYLGQGQHYVTITGVGNSGVPYSNYGSLGQYFITGTVPADASVEEPENPDTPDPEPEPEPDPEPEPEVEPDMCPNSVFDNGMMWSGDIRYVKNECANEGQMCPMTWFYGPYKRIDAQCIDGAWTQIGQ